MSDKEIEELAKAFQNLDALSQFTKSFDIDLSENQMDLLFGQLLNDPKNNIWTLSGLAANPRLSLEALRKCIYSPIGTHFFAIQNPRLEELKVAHQLPIHQIESVRNALGQHDTYQALLNESSSTETSQERFADLASLNLMSASYISFRHDRDSIEALVENLFTEVTGEHLNISKAAEVVLQKFVDYDLSPEYPELLWRVQANRKCEKFQSVAVSYWDFDPLSFEHTTDLLDMLPARLAFVVTGESELVDETWPMGRIDESPFELDIENALRMAHPSTSDSLRIGIINKLIHDVVYDPTDIAANYIGQDGESFMMMDLDSNNNWITLLSAILYTQDTELLESIAQGDNDLWKLAVILNPSATPEIAELADDFEVDFSIDALPEVDFFEEMVEYAIQTHDLEAAKHWQSLAEVSDNLDGDDEDFDEEDDDFEDD